MRFHQYQPQIAFTVKCGRETSLPFFAFSHQSALWTISANIWTGVVSTNEYKTQFRPVKAMPQYKCENVKPFHGVFVNVTVTCNHKKKWKHCHRPPRHNIGIMENDIRKSNSNKILGALFIWFHAAPFYSLHYIVAFLFDKQPWWNCRISSLKYEPIVLDAFMNNVIFCNIWSIIYGNHEQHAHSRHNYMYWSLSQNTVQPGSMVYWHWNGKCH